MILNETPLLFSKRGRAGGRSVNNDSMGKNPSRPSRHTRRKQQRLDRGFTLTVGAAPTSRRASGAVVLHNELRLVRSSLLYADQVDLIAPAASLLWTFPIYVD